jgi:hypothetical protein
MKIKRLEPFKPGENCFLQDAFNMGIQIGMSPAGGVHDRIMVMHGCFETGICHYIIVIDEATGERVRLEFDEEVTHVDKAD